MPGAVVPSPTAHARSPLGRRTRWRLNFVLPELPVPRVRRCAAAGRTAACRYPRGQEVTSIPASSRTLGEVLQAYLFTLVPTDGKEGLAGGPTLVPTAHKATLPGQDPRHGQPFPLFILSEE